MDTLRTLTRIPLVCAFLASAVPARADAPAPAGSAVTPQPTVAMVPLAAEGKVDKDREHLGRLLAVLLETQALRSNRVQVVTQGALAEMLGDLGVAPNAAVDEARARTLAQLSGATLVLFGTFAAADKGKLTVRARHFGVVAGTTKDLPEVTGTPAEVLQQLSAALSKEWGLEALPAVPVPATAKSQKGYVACVSQAALGAERSGIKGRKLKVAPAALAGCKDAAADKALTDVEGLTLSIQTLAGDAAAAGKLSKYLAAHPEDRLAGMALVRSRVDAGDYDEAGKLLADLRKARPRDADVLRLAGEVEVAKDNWDGARTLFQQAVVECPNSPYLRYRLSYASYRTDKPQDALAHAKAALNLAGYEAAPFYQLNLAERLLDSGEVMEAILQLTRSVEQTPNKLTPRVRLGYAYLLAGDLDRALEQLNAAEKLKATEREKERGIDALLQLDLARVHAAKGNTKEALRCLEALKKAGVLEPADLQQPEFVKLKDDPKFKKLGG